MREALFGDEEYGVLWEKRIGFARVAIEANVVSHFYSCPFAVLVCGMFFDM